MRLICPNCDAQYEVDDAVIPDEGRDVQCSNCGHTWFQLSEGAEAPATAAAQEAPPPRPEPEDVAWHEETAPATPQQDSGEDEEPDTPAPEEPAAAQRRELDSSVLSILKEEAAREQRAREEEAAQETFSSQPDLGLEPAAKSPPPVEAPPPDPVAPRRDLLPDIEEINSTLTASSDRGDESIVTAETKEAEERSAFRWGFGFVVLAAALAVAVYLLGPTIGGLHPALEGPMTGYVAAIDALRAWLDSAVPRALEGATRTLNGEGG